MVLFQLFPSIARSLTMSSKQSPINFGAGPGKIPKEVSSSVSKKKDFNVTTSLYKASIGAKIPC